ASSVAVLGGVTVGWLLGVVVTTRGAAVPEIAARSPIVGITLPTLAVAFYTSPEGDNLTRRWLCLSAVCAAVAAALGWATVLTFDRSLGRMPEVTRTGPFARAFRTRIEKFAVPRSHARAGSLGNLP